MFHRLLDIGRHLTPPSRIMPLAVQTTIPVLRTFDDAKAAEFYVDYLGFVVDWQHRFEPGRPLYQQVSRGGLTLHLSGHHGDACPGACVFLRVTGLAEFHAELAAKNYGAIRPGIEPTFHGSRQVAVTDPFGNRLRFDEGDSE